MSKIKLLALLGFITLIGLFASETISKAENVVDMDPDGNITYDTEDTEASSGTRYRTLGIMIEPHATNGTPNWRTNGKLMYNGVEPDSYKKNGKVYTTYTFDKTKVEACFDKSGVTEETLEYERTHNKWKKRCIYLNWIHQVIYTDDDGNILREGGKYYTLKGIREAKKWRDPSGFAILCII